MRTQIKAHSDREVTLAYDEWDGERLVRKFTRPEHGGYVTEVFDGKTYSVAPELVMVSLDQPNVLYCGKHVELVDIIRREYRVMKSRHGR